MSALGPGGQAPSHSECLSFWIREMGTFWGSVGIPGHPGRGCKDLSGQPEVLPRHLLSWATGATYRGGQSPLNTQFPFSAD